jgi:hypothetical protein
MAKFSFDKHGNIVPYEVHPVSIIELEEEFVLPFTKSVTRGDILEGHNNYIIELFQILEQNFFQWLDGSFVTQKLDPNDIDVINFVHYSELTNEKAHSLRRFLTHIGNPKEEFKVDGFLVPVYEPTDPRFSITKAKYNEWRLIFGNDRNGNPKGLLQLDLIQNDL